MALAGADWRRGLERHRTSPSQWSRDSGGELPHAVCTGFVKDAPSETYFAHLRAAAALNQAALCKPA